MKKCWERRSSAAGWVAGEHARAYQKCARTRLVAVGSRKEESARKCAEYAGVPDAFVTTDFDALLEHPDVDVISITTPPDLHPELTIRAANGGKHVCIEKPIALDWKSCLQMQKAVREAGVKTVVSFCLHWNPSLLNTRALIDQGAIGKPYYVEVDYWHGMKKWYPQYPWSVTKTQGGSSLLSAGCHAVDAMRWFAGVDNEVVEVSAYNVPHRGDNKDWEYDPTTVMICRFRERRGRQGGVDPRLQDAVPVQRRRGRHEGDDPRQPAVERDAVARADGLGDGADGPARQRRRDASPVQRADRGVRGGDPGRGEDSAGPGRRGEDARGDFRGGPGGGDGQAGEAAAPV